MGCVEELTYNINATFTQRDYKGRAIRYTSTILKEDKIAKVVQLGILPQYGKKARL